MALQSHSVIEPVSHTVRHHPSSDFLICSSLFSLCDLALQCVGFRWICWQKRKTVFIITFLHFAFLLPYRISVRSEYMSDTVSVSLQNHRQVETECLFMLQLHVRLG